MFIEAQEFRVIYNQQQFWSLHGPRLHYTQVGIPQVGIPHTVFLSTVCYFYTYSVQVMT